MSPHHRVVAFTTVLCESILLLCWRAETLEVQLLSLTCVQSPLLHGPSPVTPHQSLEELHFLGGPSLLHPLADATGLPPHSSPYPSCPPLQSLDCSMRACQLERGTSCLTRPCAQSLQAAVSSGHAAGSRSCSGQRTPDSLSRGSPKSSLQVSDTERAPDVLVLWEVHLCGKYSVGSLIGVWGQVGSAGLGVSHQ